MTYSQEEAHITSNDNLGEKLVSVARKGDREISLSQAKLSGSKEVRPLKEFLTGEALSDVKRRTLTAFGELQKLADL